jgi:hypothetical protein
MGGRNRLLDPAGPANRTLRSVEPNDLGGARKDAVRLARSPV